MTNAVKSSRSGVFNGVSRAVCLIALLMVGATELHAEPADGCPRTVYFSTGDHQDLLWVPLDSAASIDAAFTTLRDRYQVERIWWRVMQIPHETV